MIVAWSRRASAAALVLTAAFVAATPGHAETGQARRPPEFLAEATAGEWLTTRILGATVVNDRNETIGDVSDLVVGPDGRLVAYVVGVGGFLGIGEKSVAVPFSQADLAISGAPRGDEAAEPPRAPDRIVLHASREDLAKAPEYRARSRAGLSLQGLRRAVP